MNDSTKLLLRIVTFVALVCFFYLLISWASAVLIHNTVYVLTAKDIVIPLLLGLAMESNDIKKAVLAIRE